MSRENPESAVATRVADWLSNEGWDVYTEVSLYGGGSARADIVATSGRLVWVVEVKATWSLSLFEQAARWVGRAHFVSMACPFRKMTAFKERLIRREGVGLLLAGSKVEERIKPPLMRTADVSRLREVLSEPLMKAWGAAPGNNYHDFWSPYKQTCREVLRRVTENPGLTTKELMDGLRHHYQTPATARASLQRWAQHGKVPGVVFRDGAWWPAEDNGRSRPPDR